MIGIETALREAGLERYYVLVGSQKDYDFAVWMGYEPVGYHLENTEFEFLGKGLN